MAVVVRLADSLKTFYAVDPRLTWEIGSDKVRLNLEWEVLPSQTGDLPKLYPGRSISLDLVKPGGSGWEVVPHMVNGSYVVEDATIIRLMRHLRYTLSLRRDLL